MTTLLCWRAPDIPTTYHRITPMMSWHQTKASSGAAGGIMMVSRAWCLSHLCIVSGKIIVTTEAETGAPCTRCPWWPVSNWLANRKHSFWSKAKWSECHTVTWVTTSPPPCTAWRPAWGSAVGRTWPSNWGATFAFDTRNIVKTDHLLIVIE